MGSKRILVAVGVAALAVGIAIPVLLLRSDSSTQPAADDGEATVDAFLQARVDGDGAEAFVAEGDVPLLYASTSGVDYERYESAEVIVPGWTTGRVFKVELSGEDGETIVEQLLELDENGIHPRDDWWAVGDRLLPGTTENGTALGDLFDWPDFRLYDGNDGESPDNPEVPDEFTSSEWFLGGIFFYLSSEEIDSLDGNLAHAETLLDDLESHVYWREQGGEWVELALVVDRTRNAMAPWGEVLPILQHTYHIFPAGSLAPGIYEWRWVLLCTDPFWAEENCSDESVNGEIHIVA